MTMNMSEEDEKILKSTNIQNDVESNSSLWEQASQATRDRATEAGYEGDLDGYMQALKDQTAFDRNAASRQEQPKTPNVAEMSQAEITEEFNNRMGVPKASDVEERYPEQPRSKLDENREKYIARQKGNDTVKPNS